MEALSTLQIVAIISFVGCIVTYSILEWIAQKRISTAHERLDIASDRIKNLNSSMNEQVAIVQLLKEEVAILRKGNKDLTACLEKMKREFGEMNSELASLSRSTH